jgi:hypothetical protein
MRQLLLYPSGKDDGESKQLRNTKSKQISLNGITDCRKVKDKIKSSTVSELNKKTSSGNVLG